MSTWKGQLRIDILSARDLKVADLVSSDPYANCILNFQPKDEKEQQFLASYRTSVIKSNLNPNWNEIFEIPVELPEGTIHLNLKIWDRDVGMQSDFLGQCFLDLDVNSPILSGHHTTINLVGDEKFKNSKAKGTITLSAKYVPNHENFVSTNQYHVYTHHGTGLARTIGSAEAPRTYETYKINMTHVAVIFGKEKQPWNKDYEAAQKIYTSKSIKGVIELQHRNLYTNHSGKGVIKTGEQFLSLLKNGVLGGRPRFFTYALMDEHFFFSETGAAFFSDFTSKHAMHASCAEYVRYAGEFHFRRNNHGTFRLVIDNNSGTFAPDPKKLDLLKRTFEINFPGLEVEVLDFKDPKLKQYKDEYDKM